MMLIHRSVAEWIMRGLNASIDDVRLMLLQSSEYSDRSASEQSQNEDDLLCLDDEEEEDCLKKHYLFSVNKYAFYFRYSIVS